MSRRATMPEGDTIFRTARTLHRALAGHPIARFESVLPQLTRVDVDTPLAGRTVERVLAAGKHVLMEFSGGLVLQTHMRMNGSWHLYRPGERWRRPRRDMRLLVATASFEAVAFNVPVAEFRRAADAGRPLAAALARPDPLTSLGPDLMNPALDVSETVERMRAAGPRLVGEVLLDQRVIAGIGNVYQSEVCFLCRINPFTMVTELERAQLEALVSTARRLLVANAHEDAPGRIVTRRTLRSVSRRVERGEELWVYGRAGRPCHRCGAAVRRAVRGEYDRVTYWCPSCAPDAAG